jgi:hypothetical protein
LKWGGKKQLIGTGKQMHKMVLPGLRNNMVFVSIGFTVELDRQLIYETISYPQCQSTDTKITGLIFCKKSETALFCSRGIYTKLGRSCNKAGKTTLLKST